MSVPVSSTPEPHDCDSGDFDRTICPEPCNEMHSYCSICGARSGGCLNDPAPVSSPTPDEQAAEGQKRARELWESLPVGTPVMVKFLGGEAEPAKRTRAGWEADSGMTGCTPHSVRVDEVWLRADSDFPASVALRMQLTQLGDRIDALEPGPYNDDDYAYGWDDAIAAVKAVLPPPSPPTYTTEEPT